MFAVKRKNVNFVKKQGSMKTIVIILESNSYWNVLKDLSDEVNLD